jgi:hypothetical protein
MELVPPSRLAILKDTVDLLQKRAGRKLTQYSDPSVKSLCLTLDKVNVASRPFVWYAIVGGANYIVKRWFEHKWNAQHGNYNGLEYVDFHSKNAFSDASLDISYVYPTLGILSLDRARLSSFTVSAWDSYNMFSFSVI